MVPVTRPAGMLGLIVHVGSCLTRGYERCWRLALTMRTTGRASPNRQDFTVYCGDWPMGRIYEESGGPEHMR